jgi:Fe-S cluster assembly protein SufD
MDSKNFSEILNAPNVETKISAWREEAKKRFLLANVPSRKEEAWRYLNVKPIFETNYIPSKGQVAAKESPFLYNIVFINGVLDIKSTKLPKGMSVTTLSQAMEDKKVDVYHYTAKNQNLFTDLNLASVPYAYFIEITQEISEPVHISHNHSEVGNFSSNLIYVYARKNSRSIFLDESSTETHFLNHQWRFILEDNARVDWTQIHQTTTAHKYQNVEAELKKNATLEYTQVNMGGGIVRQDLRVDILEAGAHANLQGLYLLKDSQVVDNHTAVNHLAPHATCKQNYKGILDNQSRAIFDGKIYVAPGADGTQASQLNKNILLSNSAEVDTKPQLEIYADDVKCNHGATLGKFSEEELFYFLARGIERQVAIQMLSIGFVRDIVLQIGSVDIQKYLLPKLQKTLKDYSF